MVSTITDNRGIDKDNWFLDEGKIKLVMNELEKIGKYFGNHISNWVNS